MYNQCVPQAATYLPQSCQITKVWQMTVPVLVEFGGWFGSQSKKRRNASRTNLGSSADSCSAMCQCHFLHVFSMFFVMFSSF